MYDRSALEIYRVRKELDKLTKRMIILEQIVDATNPGLLTPVQHDFAAAKNVSIFDLPAEIDVPDPGSLRDFSDGDRLENATSVPELFVNSSCEADSVDAKTDQSSSKSRWRDSNLFDSHRAYSHSSNSNRRNSNSSGSSFSNSNLPNSNSSGWSFSNSNSPNSNSSGSSFSDSDWPNSPDCSSSNSNSSRSDEYEHNENVELYLGKYLGNKLGILFVVLGCAFALLYEFQYFTPLLKILCGLVISAGLVVGGSRFEQKRSMSWYGRGLTGGGWALAYFTFYAAHNFDVVRVINSDIADLSLLLLTAAGAVAHSLRLKSETITGIMLLLGFITTSISNITSFTLFSCVILVSALCYMCVRMRWFTLLVVGTTVYYTIFLSFVVPQMQSAPLWGTAQDTSSFYCVMVATMLGWLAFSAAAFVLETFCEQERAAIVALAAINGLGTALAICAKLPDWLTSWRPYLAFYLGATYGAQAWTIRSKKTLHSVLIYMSLFLCTIAAAMKWSETELCYVWLCELVLLVGIGLKKNIPQCRRFAALFAAVLGCTVATCISRPASEANTLLLCVASLAFSLCATLQQTTRPATPTCSPDSFTFDYYAICSLLLLMNLVNVGVSSSLQPLGYATASWICIMLGFELRDEGLRIGGGIVGFLAVSIALCSTAGNWGCLPSVILCALLYSLTIRYRSLRSDPRYAAVQWVGTLYHLSASLILTMLLAQVCESGSLTASWACEAMLMLLAGLLYKETVLRWSGLAVLALVIGKLLFVDLASAQALYRIISFIVAGVVMLASSYAYAQFASSGDGAGRQSH